MVVETAVSPKLARLRDQMPAVLATGYFNAGSNGPLPIAAHEALVATATTELEAGRIVPGQYDSNRLRNRRLAALIAELFGAGADEIALTHSTSEGLATVLMGLTWRAGRRGRLDAARSTQGCCCRSVCSPDRFGVVAALGGRSATAAATSPARSRRR